VDKLKQVFDKNSQNKKLSNLTSSTVEAVLMGALVDDPGVAVDAGVAWRAAAAVRALARVEAGGSVLARLVRCAVVQILAKKIVH